MSITDRGRQFLFAATDSVLPKPQDSNGGRPDPSILGGKQSIEQIGFQGINRLIHPKRLEQGKLRCLLLHPSVEGLANRDAAFGQDPSRLLLLKAVERKKRFEERFIRCPH